MTDRPSIECAACGWRHTIPCGRDDCPYETTAVVGPSCSTTQHIATLTARCEALEKEKDTLREALKRENKEICEAVTDAVRWQVRYHEAMLEVRRTGVALMGTVRVEHCPDCGQMVGEGTLYEHQQRVHRVVGPEFTQTELSHLLTLLRDHRREGSYYGNRLQHYKRNDRLFAKLEQKWCALTGKTGWPLPSVENRHE